MGPADEKRMIKDYHLEYVKFDTEEDAQNAMNKKNATEFKGRDLIVKVVDPSDVSPAWKDKRHWCCVNLSSRDSQTICPVGIPHPWESPQGLDGDGDGDGG
ncbi:hypothetical protein Sjap_006342 [Stephania japonica]|uniref:RRM domain-containing protein n=1 Tax=Stephania japonica TaxID=461633 RepID=A0AAP0PKY9_9MAGN